MLTPPNRCISVALPMNRATRCFDTRPADRAPGVWVPACIFGGNHAQTVGDRLYCIPARVVFLAAAAFLPSLEAR